MTSPIEGMERLLSRFARMADSAEARAQAASVAEAERIAERARELVRVRTGQTRDSVSVVPVEGGAEVRVTAPQAPYVEARDHFLARAVEDAKSGFGQRMADDFAREGES